MRARNLLAAAAAAAGLAAPASASAKPHISGTFAFPRGLEPGGFVIHGVAAGPGNTVWMTTDTTVDSHAKPVLLRIGASGHTTAVKINVPGGISFSGVGLGPGSQIWFSGDTGASPHNTVNGTVAGTTAHFVTAAGVFSWSQLAVVGTTAYATTGFNVLLSSTNGTTFSSLILENVDPFDIEPFGGGLAVAGDGAIGVLGAGAIGVSNVSGTLLTSPVGTALSSRYATVAQGKLWFLQQEAGGGVEGVGFAGTDGVVTVAKMPGARNITTGPDGFPWVLTASSAERLGPTGAVTATVRLPHGETGILIGGASRKYVWVGALNRASAKSKLIRIAVS